MRILDCIRDAKRYICGLEKDPLTKYLKSSEDEHFLLIPNSLTYLREDFVKLFEEYKPVELFEISNCFLGTWREPYMYMHITKKPVDSFKIAVYDKPAHIYRDDEFDPECGHLRLCDKYIPEYLQYLNKLDAWRQTGVTPEDVGYEQKFRTVPISEFNSGIIYTRIYLDYNAETRRVLRNEQIVSLSDVAEVLSAKWKVDAKPRTVRILDDIRSLKYPYIPEFDTIDDLETTIQLQKGDIVAHRNRFFLIDKDAEFDVYAPQQSKVIRANKDISPEYLYLFLTSKIAQRIRSVLTIPVKYIVSLDNRKLDDFPIVKPKENTAVYQDQFRKISAPDERVYQRLISPDENGSVGEILQTEILESIKLNNEELLRSHVEKDLDELNRCYSSKAYKGAIMLAGSVLETFLIDWISEIEGIDYFKFKYNKGVKDKKKGEYKDPSMVDYICCLEKHFYPRWCDEAKKADYIRDKRNLIHVKRCLKRSEEITDEVCNKVIENLKSVIESRKALS